MINFTEEQSERDLETQGSASTNNGNGKTSKRGRGVSPIYLDDDDGDDGERFLVHCRGIPLREGARMVWAAGRPALVTAQQACEAILALSGTLAGEARRPTDREELTLIYRRRSPATQ